MASEPESELQDTINWGREWLIIFNARKTQLVSFNQSKNTGAIDVKMGRSVLEEKSYFIKLGLTFSCESDCDCYIMSIAKSVSKKIGPLICSIKFLEAALHLYKSTIRLCMQYCCHVWAGALIC